MFESKYQTVRHNGVTWVVYDGRAARAEGPQAARELPPGIDPETATYRCTDVDCEYVWRKGGWVEVTSQD